MIQAHTNQRFFKRLSKNRYIKMKQLIYGLVLFALVSSCKNKVDNTVTNKVNEINYVIKETVKVEQKNVLTKVDSTNIDLVKQIYPLSWERFGVDNGDTVTYSFCYANIPEFSISNNLESIEIIIGNELHDTFQIEKLMYNDSILRIYLKKNAHWIDSCTMILQDKEKLISKFYTNDESEMTYSYLPKTKFQDKIRIEEECDDEDI